MEDTTNPKPFNGLRQSLADDMTHWIEERLPDGFYGKITVPIENGRVQLVIVEEKKKPERSTSR